MEQRFLIDNNVIIDGFGNKLTENGNLFLSSLSPIISAVTKIEVLGWRNATKEQLRPLEDFMEFARILPIDDQVISKTIKIRQNNKIALGDAIIGATAIVYNLTILTRNIADFKNIEDLNVLNPYDL
jgi:predicted nucleic acid-binding protein